MDFREFPRRRDGVVYALDGGLWLHRFTLDERPMAHLVSSDRDRLVAWGRTVGLDARWLQYKPLRDPRTGERVATWHWDLWGDLLPPRADARGGSGGSGGAGEPSSGAPA